MQCPFCQTENHDDQEACYYCSKDLSMLRLIVNKAKHHYNQALEFAERNRVDDAIHELNNALELDASLAGAQVVLGTLYAKKEMFAEARESWQRALALNHHLEKAHDYLHKSDKSEYVFPALRKIRRISFTLAGLCVITTGLAIGFAKPDANLRDVRRALELVQAQEPDTARAMEILERVSNRRLISKNANVLADGLAEHIRQRWHELQASADAALEGNNPYLALQLLDELKKQRPSIEIKQSVNTLERKSQTALNERINRLADEFNNGRIPYQEFGNEAKRFLEVVRTGPEHDRVKALNEKIIAAYQQNMMAQATADISAAPTVAEALVKVTDWEAKHPDLSNLLREQLDGRLKAEAATIEIQVDDLIEDGELEQARQKINDLTMLYQSVRQEVPTDLPNRLEARVNRARVAQVEDQLARALAENDIDRAEEQLAKLPAIYQETGLSLPAGLAEGFAARINGARSGATLAAGQQAYASQDWERFLDLTKEPKNLTADTLEVSKLNGMRDEARKAHARQLWERFSQRDMKYEENIISAEEAAETVKYYKEVMEHLPGDLKYARGPILFYTASSYLKLGEPAQAGELLERIKKEHPKSYIRPSADKFATRFAKKLNHG